MGDLNFLCLKNDYNNFKAFKFFLPRTHTHTHIHTHTHTHTQYTHAHTLTQIPFSANGYFFYCFSPSSGFSSQSNPHSADLFRNKTFHNRFYKSINRLLLLPGTRLHRFNSFLVVYFFLWLYKTCKKRLCQESIF